VDQGAQRTDVAHQVTTVSLLSLSMSALGCDRRLHISAGFLKVFQELQRAPTALHKPAHWPAYGRAAQRQRERDVCHF